MYAISRPNQSVYVKHYVSDEWTAPPPPNELKTKVTGDISSMNDACKSKDEGFPP